MRTAPVVVLLLADPSAYARRYAAADKPGPDRDAETWEVPWPDVDTGMSGLLVLLAAVDEGLGACLFGVPSAAHAAVRALFAVPGDRRVVAAVTLGHPAPGEASRPSRRHRRRWRTRCTTGGSACPGAVRAPGRQNAPVPSRSGPPPTDVPERIVDIDVEQEMQGAFLEYAYSSSTPGPCPTPATASSRSSAASST